MKNRYLWGGILLLLIVGGFFIIAPKSATAALLYVERGDVSVNQGQGWQQAEEMV